MQETNKKELREEFKKKFEGYWRGEAIPDEICFWWLSKLDQALKSQREGDIEKIEKHPNPWADKEEIISILQTPIINDNEKE